MSANMIEIFLFVNPLNNECYESGKAIMDFSKKQSKKIKFRLIPYVNFKIVGNQISKNLSSTKSLEVRNKAFNQSYNASLAFQAALMQGKKKGIKFFWELQTHIFEEKKELTNELINQTARKLNLDKEMFLEDWDSDLVKQTFARDQKLAHEMSISDTPSCVIYNYSKAMAGYKIEAKIDQDILETLCETESPEPVTPDLLNSSFYTL